jgi:hypothetical protein
MTGPHPQAQSDSLVMSTQLYRLSAPRSKLVHCKKVDKSRPVSEMAKDALWSLAALDLAVLEHIREGVAADSSTFLHLQLPGDNNKNGTSLAYLSGCPSWREARNFKCCTVNERSRLLTDYSYW